MAEFKWKKGNKPKEDGEYLITLDDGGNPFVTTDMFCITHIHPEGRWSCYDREEDEILAYAPLPSPFRPRRKRK